MFGEEDIYGQGTVYMDMSVLRGLEQHTLDSDLESDSDASESESDSQSENELNHTQANDPVQDTMADEDSYGLQSDVDTTNICRKASHDSQSDHRKFYGMVPRSGNSDGIVSPLQHAEDTEMVDSS